MRCPSVQQRDSRIWSGPVQGTDDGRDGMERQPHGDGDGDKAGEEGEVELSWAGLGEAG